MPHGIKLLVNGDFACFTRPEMKVERVSYDLITPSAARGVLEAIYWKPQFRWKVNRIHLLKPVRFTSVRRNEVADKASAASAKKALNGNPAKLGIEVESSRQQRAALILRDVAYGIEASIEILDHRFEPGGDELSDHECAGKHLAQFERRARSGGHFHHPFLGNREFPARCEWVEADDDFPPPDDLAAVADRDFGWMLHDFAYRETTDKKGSFIESNRGRRLKADPVFYRARTDEAGIIDVNRCLAESGLPTANPADS